MSRIIKFRAWYAGEMELITRSSDHWVWFDNEGIMQTIQDGMKLMQFTGLLDKNGAEIYEGDILKTNTQIGWTVEAVYLRDSFIGRVIGNEKKHPVTHYKSMDMESWGYEIIGNIHQQPELLK